MRNNASLTLWCCLALVIGVAVEGASQEMLRNPALAPTPDGDAPAQWRFGHFRTGAEGLYDPTGGPEGNGAVGVRSHDTDQRGSWGQRIEPDGVSDIHVSGWYRTEDITARDAAMLRVTWYRDDPDDRVIRDVRPTFEPAADWTPFEAILTVPEETVAFMVEFFNYFRPGITWWSLPAVREATEEEVRAQLARLLDREPRPDEIDYHPADGARAATNPPSFRWLPVEGVETYVLQYAPEGRFDGPESVTVEDWPLTIYSPRAPLAPGQWAWRFGADLDGMGVVFSSPRAFDLPADAVEFPFPDMDQVMAEIPRDRPRVYYRAGDLEWLRRLVQTDEEYAALAAPLIRGAEARIGEDLYPEPPFLPTDDRLERSRVAVQIFRTMRPFTAGMETCAHAYILTGDERFGQEAKRRLLHFMTWDTEGSSSVFHNTEPAMDIAWRGPRTFDWIHDLLTEEERELCLRILGRRIEQINQVHRRRPFESRPYASHPGRMIGFAVEGSIVLAHDIPEARDWLDYTLRLLWAVYPAWGNPDGGWAEGPSYWTSYISRLVPVVLLLDDIGVPFKNKPFVQNTGWFGLYAVPVGAKMRPFGDGHEGGVGAGQGRLLYRFSTLYRNPYFRWYAEQLNAGPGGDPGMMSFYDPTLEARAPADLPQARLFSYIGVAAMHSNLAEPENNVYLLMRSSPYGAVSHSYADQNAFAIGAFEQALAINSGYYQLYGSPHHARWTWQTRAHNSILVDGEGQVPRSPLSRGRIVQFDEQPQYAYAVGDATEAYGGRLERFLRRVLFIRPDTFLICDELVSAGDSTFQWLLHALEEMRLDPLEQTVLIQREDARLLARFLSPQGLELSQFSGFPVEPERGGDDQHHFTADTVTPSREMVFLTALTAYRRGQEDRVPQARELEAQGGRGVLLTWPDETALVAWRLGDARTVTVGDLETEADVAVVRRDNDGNITSVYALEGRTVRVGRTPVNMAGPAGARAMP